MASGQEVGKISIRVVPNLKRFYAELKSGLEAAERGNKVEVDVEADLKKFRAEVAAATKKLPDAEIDVKANTEAARQQIENAAKGAKSTLDVDADGAQVRRTVRKATSNLPDAVVKVKADRKGLDRFMNRMLADLNSSMAKIERRFPLTAGGEAMRREYERIEQGIKSLAQDKISPDLVIAAGQRRMILREVQEIRRKAEAKPIELKVDLEGTHRFRQRLAKIEREEENRLHRERLSHWQDELRHMKMREDETRKFLENYRREWAGRGWNLFPVELEIDREATHRLQQRIAKTKPKVEVELDVDVDRDFTTGLGRMLGRIQMPNFGTGINMAGYGVILGLITFLASPLMGVLTTTLLALPGLVAGIATPVGALLLGLDGLKKAAERLKGPFEDLKKSMSVAVENQFGPVFDQLKSVFPTLKQSLPAVTQGLADIGKSVTDVITSPAGLERIENTIQNIANALSQAGPGFADFTDGLLTLAEKFSEKFPNIAEWFNETGSDFNDWISGMAEDGTLSTAFDSLGTTIKTILDALGDLGKRGMEFMKDPENIKGFITALEQVGELLNTIMDLSEKLNGFLKHFRDTAPDQEKMNKNLLEKLKKQGKIKSDVEVESDIDLGEKLREELKKAEQGPPLGETLFNGIKERATTLVGEVTIAFGSLLGSLNGIWASVTGAAQAAFDGIGMLASAAAQRVVSVFRSIGSAISGVWNGVVAAAQAAWQAVVSAVQSAWEGVKAAVQAGIQAVISFIQNMGSQIISAITSIDLSGAGRALMEGLLSGIKAGAQAVFDFVSGIAGKIAALKGPLDYDRKVLIPNGNALMEGLETGLTTGFESVLELAKDMAGKISQAFEEGVDLSSVLGGDKLPDLKKTLDAIEQEKKRLKVEKNAATDKETKKALQSQIDQLQAQKDLLSYQKDLIKNEQKYSDEVSGTGDSFEDNLRKFIDIPKGFVDATAGQLMTDLGMSGDGMIPSLIRQGVGIGEQFIFNVSSMDEALAGKQNITNKKALQYKSR